MNELFIYVTVIHKKVKALAQTILRSVALTYKIQALLKHTSMLYGLQWLKIKWHILSCWNTEDERPMFYNSVLYWDRLWKTPFYLFNNYIDFSKVLRNPF